MTNCTKYEVYLAINDENGNPVSSPFRIASKKTLEDALTALEDSKLKINYKHAAFTIVKAVKKYEVIKTV